MKHVGLVVIVVVALHGGHATGFTGSEVTILSDSGDSRVAFGVGELRSALSSRGYSVAVASLAQMGDMTLKTRVVVSTIQEARIREAMRAADVTPPDSLKPEGFSLRKSTRGQQSTYWVVGADSAGAMYGALELAEIVRTSGLASVRPVDQNPYMALRGVKFNCPLDERTPTYHAHTGDSQVKNVLVMWDFDFWKEYIDYLARFRYNFLTLWNLHPFPSLVRVPGYEKVALDDVESVTKTLKMSMDEKIAFWRKVMRYGKDRNVDIYFVTWNIFVLGTEGKYGLTDKFDNPVTVDYFRKSVKQMFLTYPDLAGIGLTSGENMPRMTTAQKEAWAFATYGQGVLDAVADLPDRKITFIHRQHQTGAREVARRFQPLIEHPNIDFLFSFKYAKAHCFSSTRQPYCKQFVKELDDLDLKTIWTLRNDSNYYFRWGAPDFVRQFILNIPYHVSRGYYYGSDGYVWGRDFLSKRPQRPRQLEIAKHWYHWMLWGRLGYDPYLSNDRIVAVLAARFPEVRAKDLFTAWQGASMIYPVTTGFHWGALDFQWYIEGCVSRPGPAQTESGFHDVNRFITLGPHPGTDNVSIPDYVDALASGRSISGTTPLQVAQRLHDHADRALEILDRFPKPKDAELRETLGDIRAMAYLGKYYAHKIRGATELALYRKLKDHRHQGAAVRELTQAAGFWDRYVQTATSQYINPTRLNRVGVCDWQALTKEVRKDIEIARGTRWKRAASSTHRTVSVSE